MTFSMLCYCLRSNEAFITCRCTACCVSEMFPGFDFFLQNISRQASFPFSCILRRSYKTMMNLSIILNCQDFSTNMEKRLHITQRNDFVFIEKHFDASLVNILVFWLNTEVFSAPVTARKKGNDAKNSVPIFISASLIS